jgi:mannosylglycerate hydrolase
MKKQKSAKPTAIIVPHTHWDREWRYPIWKNRALLVDFMQQLLDLLDTDKDYACFVMDGQSVVIEDYLEVCPGDDARIRRHVQTGRLKIGPWYTLPDLYPIDGECLVRNLLKGVRYCRQFGGHLGVGYNSFGWGQTAQFPQIYAGFGLNFIIAAKRVSAARAPHCEYWWEAPDGTRVLASRLGKDARANGFFQAYIPVRFGMEYLSDNFRFRWGKTGQAMHRADAASAGEDYFRIDRETGYHADKVRAAFDAAWHAMDKTLAPDYRLILDGSDFSTPQPPLSRMIREANGTLPDIEWKHGTIEEYAAALPGKLAGKEVPVVHGELRDGPASHCSGNALAVRIHLKQLNKAAENALIRRAEPLASALALLGEPYPTALLERAWSYLLKAHPHDSINGVTQDKTADDTAYRINQAIELAGVVEEETVARLIRRIDTTAMPPDAVLILVVNPLARARREVLKVSVDTPREASAWDVDVFDAASNRLDTQFVARRQMTCPVHDLESRPWPFDYDRHTLHVDVGEIPAGGYKVLRVQTRKTFSRAGEWWPEMRATTGGDIAADPRTLENEHLRATVNADGTIDLTDKSRGRTMRGLHYFEDAGDIGDYWAYYPPHGNRVFTSQGQPARVWLEDNGPLTATIAVEHTLKLPARSIMPEKTVIGESRRADETTDVRITSRFTLRRGARRLDVRTTVENTAEDHRLRLMLPTGLQTDFADSAGHFTVDRRPIIPARNERGEFWPEMQTLPMHIFVDVTDGTQGFAVASNSVTEYQLLDDPSRTLAITLFRSVRNRICTEFRSTGSFPQQKGGQLLRTLEFEYALYPHEGDWRSGGVYAEALALNVAPSAFQFSPAPGGDLPPEVSLYALQSADAVLSAFKKAEDSDSFIVRAYNPAPDSARAELHLPPTVESCAEVDLNETPTGKELRVRGGKITLTLAAGQIRTWRVRGRTE